MHELEGNGVSHVFELNWISVGRPDAIGTMRVYISFNRFALLTRAARLTLVTSSVTIYIYVLQKEKTMVSLTKPFEECQPTVILFNRSL